MIVYFWNFPLNISDHSWLQVTRTMWLRRNYCSWISSVERYILIALETGILDYIFSILIDKNWSWYSMIMGDLTWTFIYIPWSYKSCKVYIYIWAFHTFLILIDINILKPNCTSIHSCLLSLRCICLHRC